MGRYGGQAIYGPVKCGYVRPHPPPIVDCSQLQAMDDYIIQLTNILGNLDRNKKIYMADTALDRMTADITTMIAAAK